MSKRYLFENSIEGVVLVLYLLLLSVFLNVGVIIFLYDFNFKGELNGEKGEMNGEKGEMNGKRVKLHKKYDAKIYKHNHS